MFCDKIGKMASNKKSQRKRKSAGVGDIFEVCEKDLSPEPEGSDAGEPEAKVQKTRDSDVSESRKNSDQHNLNADVQTKTSNDIVKENQNNVSVLDGKVDTVDVLDISESEDCIHIVEDSPQTADLICVDSDDGTSQSENKSNNEKVNTDISSNISNEKRGNTTSNSVDVDNHSSEQNTEVVTVDDEQDTSQENDVIMICDSSVDMSKDCISLHSPEIMNDRVNDNTLEDGEVNDSNLGEPETSVIPLTPSITITFRDESAAELYKHKFWKFIQSFVELEACNVDDRTIHIFRDSNLDPKEWVVLDNTVCNAEKSEEEELAKKLPATPKPENAKRARKRKKKVKQEEKLFVVDTEPGAVAHSPAVAKYSTKFLINDQKPGDEKDSISKPTFASLCFNCGKEHSLRDCTVPKNFNRISANRQKFQNKNKTSRYHVEEDQKYAHFKPGIISPDLRKALGLKKHQIPCYVYQMRVLGYPPGWLEVAKVVTSDLTMFDIDGKDVKNTNTKQIRGLDPEKVIDYPGFNVPLETEFKDEYRLYRVPPFCDQFSKEHLIESFKKHIQREQDDFETRDMDLDNNSDSELQNKQIDSSIDSDTTIMSLQELQKQKDSLLEEIKKSGETIPWEQPSDDTNPSSVDGDTLEKPKKDNSKSDVESSENHLSEGEIQDDSREAAIVETDATNPILDATVSPVREKDDNSASSKVNTVKSSIFGTPIIKTNSPYNRLPNADNFTKGVSPVIDFENLPNSTGKYEQMTGVLQKVRSTLKNLHKSKT